MAFYPVQLQDLKLVGAGMSAGATSFSVQSLKIPNTSTNVTMANFGAIGYGVLEPGTSKEEIFSFTGITQNADGTATFTGVTTGINFVTPYDSQVGFKYGHAGNAIVRISNVAAFFQEFAKLKNTETVEEVWTFTDPNLPRVDTYNAPTDPEQFATKAYVDATATGSTTTNKLIVNGTAGETVAAGDVIYFDYTDNEWKLASAASASTCSNVMLGIAQGDGTDGNTISGGILLYGRDDNQSGLTLGDIMYISDTPGEMSNTPGTVSVPIGIATRLAFQPVLATSINFEPNFNRFLTKDQQDALAGTSGTPSSTNLFVTNDDTASAATANKVARRNATGDVTVPTTPTASTDAASKAYVDTLDTDIKNRWIESMIPIRGIATYFDASTVQIDFCFSDDLSNLYMYVGNASAPTAAIYRFIQDSTGTYYYNNSVIPDSGGAAGSCRGGITFYNNQIYVIYEYPSSQVMKRYDSDLTNETAITISGGNANEYCCLTNDGTTFYVLDVTDLTGGYYTLSGTTLTRGGDISSITGAHSTANTRVKCLQSTEDKLLFAWNNVTAPGTGSGLTGCTFEEMSQSGGAATEISILSNFDINSCWIVSLGENSTSTEFAVIYCDSTSASGVTEFNMIKISKSALGI